MNQNYKSTPITELSNETTIDIDSSDSTGIVRILRQCDGQIFSGWRDHPCIYDMEILEPLENLNKHIQQALLHPDNYCVVFSGCGTSGRIGFMLANKFNALSKEQDTSGPFRYIIAGGDTALFSSVEMPEDDWRQGQHDLKELVKDKKKVVYIGVSCGLSASYVAGQLDYCMDYPDIFLPVLLGFNPVHLARKNTMENCSKTFFDVASRLSQYKDGIIINPVIGPEAITGSSRMKGASATKILLETVLIKAHVEALIPGCHVGLRNILPSYESVFRETYLHIPEISQVVSLAGESLRKGQHVYYLAWSSPSFVAVLDASECVPTFSSSFNDVRAFISGGLESFGIDGSGVQTSIEHFVIDILPNVTNHDTVIIISISSNNLEEVTEVAKKVSQKGARIAGLISQHTTNIENFLDICITLDNGKYNYPDFLGNTNIQECFRKCLDEMSLKLFLNAVSTGGHVIKGKILQNLMIDVKVSNNKLFRRAVGIVSELSRVSEDRALTALLQAIYRREYITDSMRKDVISNHVSVGTHKERVVPLAILLATDKFTVQSGLKALDGRRVAELLKELTDQESSAERKGSWGY